MRAFFPLAVFSGIIVALSQAPAQACPFCTMQGQTLSDDAKQAGMVLFGTLGNARLSSGQNNQGSTDLAIESVIKNHEFLGKRKVITLPRYLPVQDKKVKFLIFCDVFKGQVDPYRGVAVSNDDVVKYLNGSLALSGKDRGARLLYFFKYLDHADTEIANDAYKEFGNAGHKDYATIAKQVPADQVARWLSDPKTYPYRYGLYASMLGQTGQVKYADTLRNLLTGERKVSTGVDGILAGYIMLKPKEGWQLLKEYITDSAGAYVRSRAGAAAGNLAVPGLSREFLYRYAALRTIRFFWESHPGVIGKPELSQAMATLLTQADVADLAIEDLRKWGCWDMSKQVIALYGQPSHDAPFIRRAILRYALSCPNQPEVKQFVDRMRKQDGEMVKDIEELLKFEQLDAKTAS